jgi:protein O-GlcNAc transferase
MASLHEALALALDRHQAGDLTGAETLYRRILDTAPETAAAWHYLGLLFGQSGRLPPCVTALRRACALVPTQTDSYRQAARACEGLGDRQGAYNAWRAVADLQPDDAAAAHGAGVAALASGNSSAALDPLTRAAALSPEKADGLVAAAGLFIGRADWAGAERATRRLLCLQPDNGDAWDTIGSVACRHKDRLPAISAFGRALRLNSDKSESWANLSRTLAGLHRIAPSWAALRCAAALAPADPGVLHDLGAILLNSGDSAAASRWAARGGALDPADKAPLMQRIVAGLYHDNGDDAEARFARSRALWPPSAAPRPARRSNDGGPLRVGYVSADLWGGQPVVRNMLPVLRHNDPNRTALYFYIDAPQEDATGAELAGLAARRRNTHGQSNEQVADSIRADGVDVLVFLAGHFDNNRIALAAHRAAPAQISFHDVATSGAPTMDFLIADRVMIPRNAAERFTERPLRLPHFYIADLPDPAPPVNALPALRNGFVTFGSFNNPAKLSDETLDVWGRLLARLPAARLALRYFDRFKAPVCAERIYARLSEHSVSAERLVFPADAGDDRNDHLKLYHGVDIALDPFPFNGSTTSFEALCMGVPVIARSRDRMVGRWGASMLDALGLQRLIADSAENYIDIAVALTADLPGLAALRAGLRNRVAGSSLTNVKRKARELERLYRAAWACCAKSR